MPENTWYRRGPDWQSLPAGQAPVEGTPIGVPEGEPLGVYISTEAADFIGKYVMADIKRPLGGILVGYVIQDDARPNVLISGAIEGRDAESVNEGVAFTDATWDYMKSVWEREYPDTLVVGWFCSHPGRGGRLSGYHRFNHHRYFNRPWQLLFTIDPIENTSLFYRWEGERLAPVENFTLWHMRREPIARLAPDAVKAADATRKVKAPASAIPAKGSEEPADGPVEPAAKHLHPAVWLLLAAALCALLLWPTLPWSLPHLWAVASERQSELEDLRRTITAPADTQQPGASSSTPAPVSAAPPQSAPLTAEEQQSRASPPDHSYEVQPGDTLWRISKEKLGDPLAYRRVAEVNNIANPSLIHPGNRLTLPEPPPATP